MNCMHKQNVFYSLLKKESRDLFKAPIILIIIGSLSFFNLYINCFYDGRELAVIFFEKLHISAMIVSLVIIIQYLNDSTLNDIDTGGIIFLLNIGSSLRKLFFIKVMFGVFIGFLITIWGFFKNENDIINYIISVFLLFYNVGIICIIVSTLCGKDKTVQWFIISFLAFSYYFTLLEINNTIILYLLHLLVFIITQLIFTICINNSFFRAKLK